MSKDSSDTAKPGQALVIGAGGGIGQALVAHWAADPAFDRVWAVTRQAAVDDDSSGRVVHSAAAGDRDSIAPAAARITAASPDLRRVAITLGTLHGDGYGPEKSLDALEEGAMLEVYRVNCVLPLLWVAALGRALRGSADCRIAVFSARVGSIADNRLGGWYSYRSAKAGLNMGLRTAAIELARRAPGLKLVAFHPGTVATPLSAPFSRNVPADRLFDPSFAAARLAAVLAAQAPDGELSYLDWAGEPIPW